MVQVQDSIIDDAMTHHDPLTANAHASPVVQLSPIADASSSALVVKVVRALSISLLAVPGGLSTYGSTYVVHYGNFTFWGRLLWHQNRDKCIQFHSVCSRALLFFPSVLGMIFYEFPLRLRELVGNPP